MTRKKQSIILSFSKTNTCKEKRCTLLIISLYKTLPLCLASSPTFSFYLEANPSFSFDMLRVFSLINEIQRSISSALTFTRAHGAFHIKIFCSLLIVRQACLLSFPSSLLYHPKEDLQHR